MTQHKAKAKYYYLSFSYQDRIKTLYNNMYMYKHGTHVQFRIYTCTLYTFLQGRISLCMTTSIQTHIFSQDPNRLHYEPWELQVFERIECQWPMFFALFVLDGLFNGREEQVCLKG